MAPGPICLEPTNSPVASFYWDTCYLRDYWLCLCLFYSALPLRRTADNGLASSPGHKRFVEHALTCPMLHKYTLTYTQRRSRSFSPSTLLAIVTAVSNSAIALAHMEAVPISWWYSATHGRSIEALERQWKVTRSAFLVRQSRIPRSATTCDTELGSYLANSIDRLSHICVTSVS